MFLPHATYQAVTEAILGSAAVQQLLGSSFFATSATGNGCMALTQSPTQIDTMLPPLVLGLGAHGDVKVELAPSQSYLSWSYPSAGSNSHYVYCPNMIDDASDPSGPQDFLDLGETLMLGHVLVYDRANHRFGVAAARSCP
jgi:hypothetical protein